MREHGEPPLTPPEGAQFQLQMPFKGMDRLVVPKAKVSIGSNSSARSATGKVCSRIRYQCSLYVQFLPESQPPAQRVIYQFEILLLPPKLPSVEASGSTIASRRGANSN